MKKLTIAFIAVVCMAMFIAPAYADDRVSLSGSMRVRGWDVNNSDSSDASWMDQRFRIQTKINVADDVTAVLRIDYGDGTWGDSYGPGGGLIVRPRAANSNIDVDRGYLNIDKEMWSLTAGQQYLGLGVAQVLDANATALKLVFKLPVKTSLIYIKETENGGTNDDLFDDSDVYAVNFGYSTDAFSAKLYAITRNDETTVDDSATMFGFNGSAALGMVDLTGELDFAAGDTADGATDYVGTQFYLKAAANLSDAFSMGAEFLYALGTDNDNEQQLTGLSNWWSFVPTSSNTPEDAEITAFANADPFDPTGSNGGVQGITLFGKYNVMDALSLGAKVGYFTPEEDANTDTDDITTFNVWTSYQLATNTQFHVTYLWSEYDDLDDNYDVLLARLQVNF